jgi:hypothetical protein
MPRRRQAARSSHRPAFLLRTGKHGTGKVEIVARAVWQAPPHAGKNMEFLGDVSGHYDR